MNVIKLIIFGLAGFFIFSAYQFITEPINFEMILAFGLGGMFIGFGVGIEVIGFTSLKANYFMAIIGIVFTSTLMYLLDFSLFWGIIGGVVGFYHRNFIDIFLKS
ncbi:hypothetical protein ACQEXU_07780 [Vibrio sp. TRT 21S02]|uniref:hypothetical protein n=1 Tax=Vibrio sp. TRT 21S02 TaxID=3418507 RepID=UPI003CFA627B